MVQCIGTLSRTAVSDYNWPVWRLAHAGNEGKTAGLTPRQAVNVGKTAFFARNGPPRRLSARARRVSKARAVHAPAAPEAAALAPV